MTGGFGDRLRDALAFSGLTHTEVAERIGSRPELISRWLKLGAPPRSKYVAKAASETGVDLAWLRTGDGPPPPSSSAAAGKAALGGQDAVTRAEHAQLAARLARLEERQAAVDRWIAERHAEQESVADRIEQAIREARDSS